MRSAVAEVCSGTGGWIHGDLSARSWAHLCRSDVLPIETSQAHAIVNFSRQQNRACFASQPTHKAGPVLFAALIGTDWLGTSQSCLGLEQLRPHLATMQNGKQRNDHAQRNKKKYDSTMMMEFPLQKSRIDPRSKFGNHENAEAILGD